MKSLLSTTLSLILALSLSITVSSSDIFTVKTSLSTKIEENNCVITATSGQVLEFSASDLEKRMGLKEKQLKGITITALPTDSEGSLFLDGVEVELFEAFDRAQLDRLCFVPTAQAMHGGFSFIPKGKDAVTTNLSIAVAARPNTSPTVENASFITMKNVGITGMVVAKDPEKDKVIIQIMQEPKKGDVHFSGNTFFYQPYKSVTGTDTFTICGVDNYGNYSKEAKVDIKIESAKTTVKYADMTGSPSQYAALKLMEKKIMVGTKIGEAYFFNPNDQVNRGELLVMVLAASGQDKNLKSTVNTKLPNDDTIPMWLKPYVKRGMEQGIISSKLPFMYSEIPTRAEAVMYTDKAAKIKDVKKYDLTMADASKIPEWAKKHYMDLAAYRMLDLYDGSAHPDRALTNSYSADLIWQLYKHCNR